MLQDISEDRDVGSKPTGSTWSGHDSSQIQKCPETRSEDTHQLAQRGTAGSAGPLPYLNQIQHSFGPRHDLGGVKTYIGGEAAEAARRMGAKAFTTGDRVVFSTVPSLRTAAHEATHVVQQRGSIQLKDGVGESDDFYERHADTVADAVERGDSAESLLDQTALTTWGHADSPLVQCLTDSGIQALEMLRDVDRQAEDLIRQYRSDPAGLAKRIISDMSTQTDILADWQRSQAAYRVLKRFPDQAGLANAISQQLPDDRVRQLAGQNSSALMALALTVRRGGNGAEAERIISHLVDPAHGHLFGETALQNPAVQGALMPHDAHLQSITGGTGPTVFDEYWIIMDAMPANLTAEAYLTEMSRDLNAAVHNDMFNIINRFRRIQQDQRRGAPTLGDVYDIDILGPDDGSVMLVERTPNHFIFQTVATGKTGTHPEFGSREFGFEVQEGGAVRWYTRGASRPGSDAAAMIGGFAQERGWTAMLSGIGNTLQSRGGRLRPSSFGHWIRRI
jgi:hypothetical protein